jgi:hypothetical protein
VKKIFVVFVFLLSTTSVFAGPGSILGAKPMASSEAHYVALGWPSLAYEWWHQGGNMDWAIGGELVYGDWSGEFSNVDIGFALNVPFRWHLSQSGRAHVGFKITPGALIGSNNAGPGEQVVGAFRGEVGVPVTIELNDRFNLITGATAPFTVVFPEGSDAFVIIPIMPRIGVEFAASQTVTPHVILELGPTIAIGDFGSEIEFGVRAWIGSVFW